MENKLFFCYSDRFHKALQFNGFKPLFVGYTLTNNKVYIYNGTKELNYYKNNIYQLERDKF